MRESCIAVLRKASAPQGVRLVEFFVAIKSKDVILWTISSLLYQTIRKLKASNERTRHTMMCTIFQEVQSTVDSWWNQINSDQPLITDAEHDEDFRPNCIPDSLVAKSNIQLVNETRKRPKKKPRAATTSVGRDNADKFLDGKS